MPATKYPHELTAEESSLARIELRLVIQRTLRDVQEDGVEAPAYSLSRLNRCATLHGVIVALGGRRCHDTDAEIERLRALLPSQTV